MAKVFALDAATKQIIKDVLDDLLANEADGGLGKSCLLVYPPKLEPCANCVFDAVTNRSSNRPRSGAPLPFPPGAPCPACGGRGLRQTEVSEALTLKCNWEPRKFLRPVPGQDVRVPHSVLEVKGYLADLPKLLKADHVVVATPVAPYVRQKFKLVGEPGDPSNIVPGRYFVALLERVS